MAPAVAASGAKDHNAMSSEDDAGGLAAEAGRAYPKKRLPGLAKARTHDKAGTEDGQADLATVSSTADPPDTCTRALSSVLSEARPKWTAKQLALIESSWLKLR